MQTVKDQLIAARAFIDTPDKWTKNALSKDASGRNTRYPGGPAVCFCTLGALRQVNNNFNREMTLMGKLAAHVPGDSFDPVGYNDDFETTHADVLALFDKAIASCDD